MPETLAVIVSYKNARFTLDAAMSAYHQGNTRVVVWDNFSSEAMQQILQKELPSSIHLELCEQNLMWPAALNRAIQKYSLGCQYIVQMNNDVRLPSHTFTNLRLVFQTDPLAGIVGPLVPALGGPQEPLDMRLKMAAHPGEPPVPFRTSFLLGACLMFPTKVYEEVGPFDESMPLGADDHDYCIRVKHAGYHLWVQPTVCIWHKGHASDGPEWEEWGGKSWDNFNNKWGGYFATEEEAITCHWGGKYHEGREKGTGWTEEEYNDRSRSSDLQLPLQI